MIRQKKSFEWRWAFIGRNAQRVCSGACGNMRTSLEPVWGIIKGFILFCITAKSTGRLWLKWRWKGLAIWIFVLIFYHDRKCAIFTLSQNKHFVIWPPISSDFENSIPFTLWDSGRHGEEYGGASHFLWHSAYSHTILLRKRSCFKRLYALDAPVFVSRWKVKFALLNDSVCCAVLE